MTDNDRASTAYIKTLEEQRNAALNSVCGLQAQAALLQDALRQTQAEASKLKAELAGARSEIDQLKAPAAVAVSSPAGKPARPNGRAKTEAPAS